MSREMAHKVIVPPKKIISRSFLNSGTLIVIMYRRPTLCTLHIAVDFLKSLKIAVVWGEGLLLGYKAFGGRGCFWDIKHILYPPR